MKRTGEMVLIVIVVLSAVAATAGMATAQVLPPTDQRCANAYSVTSLQAQYRYSWALYCRSNPIPTKLPDDFLRQLSVDAYNDPVNATIQPYLFPVYFDFPTMGAWDVPDNAGTNCALIPMGAFNVGLCIAGCYEESTPLRFGDGEVGIKAAWQAGKLDLVTLSETATLDHLQFSTNQVQKYTVDMFEEWQLLYTLSMKSGGSLRVTAEHPLLTSDGIMNQAQSLRLGDQLVRADGTFDPIVQIDVDKVFGKVYNVRPVTVDYTSNIVVAGGYLNGSQRYQNEFLDTINSLILRRALAEQADKLMGR